MNKKISIKNIVVATLLLCILALLIYNDLQRVNNDFKGFKIKLSNIRMESLIKGKSFILSFKDKTMFVTDLNTKGLLETVHIPTLKDVHYDTKLGKNTIVLVRGVTSTHNIRIHGGEIILKSWLGFTKYIHINCAGYLREGRYPDE